MKKLIRKYAAMSFEQKTVIKTVAAICCSAALACGKLVIGLFTDYTLCGIAVYTFAILISKLECVLGVKTDKRSFEQRNFLIAVFLFIASVLYIAFVCRTLFIKRTIKEYNLIYVLMLALISFTELGFAIAGLIRTKNRGHFYRDIKIINFGMALIAILTTQTTILDFNSTVNTDKLNAYSGIGVGIFIAICAVFILFAPKTSVIDRERNAFVLTDAGRNFLTNAQTTLEIPLCPSAVYGAYVYRAEVRGDYADGNIERDGSLWKRMRKITKIICCILSEILIFVWLAGRLALFLRSINLPARLEKIMNKNGFVKIDR